MEESSVETGSSNKKRKNMTTASASTSEDGMVNSAKVVKEVKDNTVAKTKKQEAKVEEEEDDGNNKKEAGDKVTNGNKAKQASASSGPAKKKQKTSSNNVNSTKKEQEEEEDEDGYKPLSLADIRTKLSALCKRVPTVPEDGGLKEDDEEEIRSWARAMQAVIEEFNLLLCCISAATYRWGSERSGAADQNLSVLSSELSNSQDQIASTVTPRLTNVLAPVVDLVISKTITTKSKDGNEEIKINEFSREQVDPSFLKLCRSILCRNAVMMRQVVLANLKKVDKCMGDYVKATKKDMSHDSRGFAY